MGNNLLLNSHPLVIIPELAIAIGLNEAIVLQQIHYWCNINQKAGNNLRDGYYWVYNSYSEWQKQFPWWCERTIKTIFTHLEKKGLLISGNYNKMPMDRTKWYRINYDALESLTETTSCKSCPMDSANITQPIPKINAENTDNNGKMEEWGRAMCPADSSVENPSGDISVPIVERSVEEVSQFINWYFEQYQDCFGTPHPNIKSNQRIRVTNKLNAFLEENCLDINALQDMTYAFFDNVEYSDHNINHFATDGILENRFYEAVY